MTIEELERLRLKQRCFYTKEEIKELLKNISLKVEVEELPATGVENYMYLVPALTEGHYNQFIWNDNQWLSLGESEENFTNYVTGPELTSAIYLYCPIIEDDRNGNSAPINGNAPFKTLKDGQIILLHIKYKTYSNATLNLTLSDGTSTGAKDIKMQSTESIVLVKKINTDYGSHVVWSYIPMVYDLSHDCWVCLSSIDTYPFMTSALIQAGNSTEGKTVTPKLLRDNFYLKSEVDNAKQNKRTFEDNPYVMVDVVIDYNDGGITQNSLSDGLDQYYDGWDDDQINTAAMNTICADLSAHTIEGVVMRSRLSSALQSTLSDIDAETADGGGSLNIVKLFLDANKYIDIGNRNSLVLVLPTRTEMVDGYEVQISGYSSNSDGFALTFAGYDNDPYDIQTIMDLLTAQEISGGASGTYDLTARAKMAFQATCTERDGLGDDVPNINSATSKLVECKVMDYARTDEFLFTFICNSDNCSLTLPTGVKYGSNLDFDNDKQEDRKFQFSIQDNIALYTYVD